MALFDPASWPLADLCRRWREASPFPHVIIDELLTREALTELVAAVSREPHWPNRSDFYEMMGSSLPLRHPSLARFASALEDPATLDAVASISGKPIRRVETRSYVYLGGSYLLPHYDRDRDHARLLAYAYYLLPESGCVGGELDLFHCGLSDGEIVAGEVGQTIAPRQNRLVIFDVSEVSLHQVREVQSGARLSLSGWYFG